MAIEPSARAPKTNTIVSLAYTQAQSPRFASFDESPLCLPILNHSATIVSGALLIFPSFASQSIEYASKNQVSLSTYAPAHIATFIGLRPRIAINKTFPNHSTSLTTAKPSQPKLEIIPMLISAKKKYKPVAHKVKPVLDDLPAKFHIIKNIIGDSLATLPVLYPHPPPYTLTGRYTQERKEQFDKDNSHFFLPDERALLHHFMMLHNDGFA